MASLVEKASTLSTGRADNGCFLACGRIWQCFYFYSVFFSFLFPINRRLKNASQRIIFKRSESGISQGSFTEHPLKTIFLP